jgi:hypothetical protein
MRPGDEVRLLTDHIGYSGESDVTYAKGTMATIHSDEIDWLIVEMPDGERVAVYNYEVELA